MGLEGFRVKGLVAECAFLLSDLTGFRASGMFPGFESMIKKYVVCS